MGRAQVYQAEACGLKPHVAMNPVLLKPSGDNRSQVIVMGKVVATQNARDYFDGRGKYIDEVKGALDYLRNTYDLVVLEGAGSPAEINLRAFDFVNMSMAKLASAPVLIVGDIDRGGVFAWMKGTYDLLTPDEQRRVSGFIINKFRGDIELLKPGIAMFENMVGKPVLGTVPFYLDFFVDEEDAIPSLNNPGYAALDVVVLRLPRISNFTDVSPLSYDPSISVRYVWHPSQIKNPDLIIIPGSKNTLDDLRFMNTQGLSKAIIECHRSGSILMGICAGFQILGRTIRDPFHQESSQTEIDGLNLFDFETTLLKEKITRQVRSLTCASSILEAGLIVDGYEIHMGVSEFNGSGFPLFHGKEGEEQKSLGITNAEGTLIGTYLHGFFDNDKLRSHFLRHVRKRRNIPDSEFDYRAFRKEQLDRLGELAANHLDMNIINKLASDGC
ncbi:MAG: cobyric acid synthase CobQ [Nitrospinae bacterium RIFCSPLOWO2_12_FULL_47_7]|nr:MAG: cobyric acid synthase CobQ [Nitrospinae bacterium RIFCSPLOWO2_12_FULL_47_7]